MNTKELTIGQRVQLARENKGLGLRACAKLIGCGASTLREIESGKTQCPSGKVLLKMCDVLGVTEGWIVNGEDGRLERIDATEAQFLSDFRQLPESMRDVALAIIRELKNKT
jgi:transcriptional regulator with XRE-family HTH domain